MAARAHVPEFGNWESQDDVPYTLYFDKARKGRGGKMINPNDPEENPEMFSNIAPSPPAANAPPPTRIRAQADGVNGRGSVKPHHEPRVSREDGNFKQFADSPGSNDNLSRRTSGESTHQHSGNRLHPGRPARQSAGSEYSIEKSPLHPHQAKLTGRGSASPASDGKNSYDSSHGAAGKSRMKPTIRGDESPDRSAAVPRFGDWDESNPQSADNYTHIFNQVREERHNVPSNVAPGNRSPYHNVQRQNADGGRKGRCFPCLGI